MDRTKPYYEAKDDITGYWEQRHFEWAQNPNWGQYQVKAQWFEERFDHLLPPVRGYGFSPIGSVLDYGCGCGLYAAPLAKRFWNYTGFDTSRSAIELARQYYAAHEARKRIGFYWYQGNPGEFGSGLKESFDLVLSITVLQHQPIPYRLAMIEDIKRILRPGGRYIGLEMNGDTYAYDMPQFPRADWVAAWQPLIVRYDAPKNHPEWADDNVWVIDKP